MMCRNSTGGRRPSRPTRQGEPRHGEFGGVIVRPGAFGAALSEEEQGSFFHAVLERSLAAEQELGRAGIVGSVGLETLL